MTIKRARNQERAGLARQPAHGPVWSHVPLRRGDHCDPPSRDWTNAESPVARGGYLLIEVLVYLSVVFVILGVGYAALYRCMDNSKALRGNAEDIASALRVGERWRADVRAVNAPIRCEQTSTGQVLHLPGVQGEVTYRFSTNAVFRSVAGGPSARLLDNVKASALISDERQNIIAWRWELELQMRRKRISGIRPLFTFIAAPTGAPAK